MNDKGPTHRQLKNEEEANYDRAQNMRDIQPEGGKDKGIEHGNSSGTHAEGQYDKRDEAQLLNQLKATGIKVGLLINFGRTKVEYKRLVF